MAGGQAIGVISVQSTTRENAFGEDEMRLLGTIAANAGSAIRTAQLHAETEHRAQEMATLAEIGNDIAASRELEPVLERIAAHAKEIMRVQDITISLREPDDDAFRTVVALGRNEVEMKALVVRPGIGILGNILKSGVAEYVNDPSSRSAGDPRARHSRRGGRGPGPDGGAPDLARRDDRWNHGLARPRQRAFRTKRT